MKNKIQSQNKAILEYLQSGKSLSPLDALDKFGCFRLSARIHDLKQEGHAIEKIMVTNDSKTKSFAEYSLIKQEKQQ